MCIVVFSTFAAQNYPGLFVQIELSASHQTFIQPNWEGILFMKVENEYWKLVPGFDGDQRSFDFFKIRVNVYSISQKKVYLEYSNSYQGPFVK